MLEIITIEQIRKIAAMAPVKPGLTAPAQASKPLACDSDPDRTQDRTQAYADKIPGAVQGSQGDPKTIKAIQKILDFASDEGAGWDAVCRWNGKCDPRWEDPDLRKKFESALKSRRSPIGCRLDEERTRLGQRPNSHNGQPGDQRQRKQNEQPSNEKPVEEREQSGGVERPADDFDEHRTDLGAAKRLVVRHGRDIRYCHTMGSWYIWDGQRWSKDVTGGIYRLAEETVRAMYVVASEIDDQKERKGALSFAMKLEARAKMEAMVAMARNVTGVPVRQEELDSHKWFLNVANGTLNLRTGSLEPHKREHLLTKLARVTYDLNANCPRWTAFLDRIMGGNQQLVAFLQRAIGYSLSGDTSEQCLFILHGVGKNGKSKFIGALQDLLGEDYSTSASIEVFLAKNQSGHPTEMAALRGSRLVTAIEPDEGRRLAEGALKQLTGGDKIAARFMRQDFFEFVPEFKIWLATNHKPVIRGTDLGIWRRIRLIPFDVVIPPAERDLRLDDKLRLELPGILSWAVRGCQDWVRGGLAEPDAVLEATATYKAEQDILGAFLADCCLEAPGCTSKVSSLYSSYDAWCQESGEKSVLTKKAFSQRLIERGFERKHQGDGAWYSGIGLKATTVDRERSS